MKNTTQLIKNLLFIGVFILSGALYAQIGIGTTAPAGGSILDVTSADKGIVVPRVNINNLANIAPITGGATIGLLVWNTNVGTGVGFHYWDSNDWIPLGASSSDDWALAGNTITAADFLGTINAQDLRIRTNNTLRARILSDGRVIINELGGPYFADDIFTAEGVFAVNGYTTTGIGVYGEGTTGNGVAGGSIDGLGVDAFSLNNTAIIGDGGFNGVVGLGFNLGVLGDDNGANTTGVQGQTTAGVGVIGLSTSFDGTWGLSTTGDGVFGQTVDGWGVYGSSLNNIGTFGESISNIGVWGDGGTIGVLGDAGTNIGVQGQTTGGIGTIGLATTGSGVVGQATDNLGLGGNFSNTGATGQGLVASGNGLIPTVLPGGGGITGSGEGYGMGGFSNNAISTAVVGVANGGGTINTLAPNGGGVAGTGSDNGVFGAGTGTASSGVVGIGGGSNGGVGVQGQGNDGVVGIGNNGNGDVGVYGEGKAGVVGQNGTNTGANNFGVFSNGDFGGTGAKYFVIDHPLDPENKFLKHANIESNEILNLYRGKEVFNRQGKAIVSLPDYYEALNINASYQLTPIGAAMPDLFIEKEVENGQFIIAGGVPGKKVSWQLTAERNDAYLQKYPSKRVMVLDKGESRGKYLDPETYGKSRDLSFYGNKKRKSAYAQKITGVNSQQKTSPSVQREELNKERSKRVDAESKRVKIDGKDGNDRKAPKNRKANKQ